MARLGALLAGAILSARPLAAAQSPEGIEWFESRIRPVLVKNCLECHSAQSKKLGGKLRLDSAAGINAGGESGPVLLAGNPKESLLMQALRYEGGLEMPPKKRLPPQVVADFARWVEMGAPDPRTQVGPALAAVPATKPLWSLRRPQPPPSPQLKNPSWPRGRIDELALAVMEHRGLTPVADAPAAVLQRRLFYDLIGLGPQQPWTGSVESLVDHLLASPRFGERWGRLWLDVVRYAESNGNDGLSRNPSFPHAWRYRDYVIESFNADVPYDRFVMEQLAGDLLPAADAAQRDRQLVATGVLAFGAKPAKAMNDHFEMDVVADQMALVGSGIMGMSLGCARCHDHKADPISTRDYYALAGVFKSTQTMWGAAAHQGLTAPQTPLHVLAAAKVLPPRQEIESIIKAHPPRRTPAKPQFVYPPQAALAMGVREASRIEDCRINIDGDSKRLGAAVARALPASLGGFEAIPIPAGQSGRLQLALWLTDERHPLTARVMVNRVWQRLFGQGLVRSVNDFGHLGEPPTHPQLLDHLAVEFMRSGWSLKALIRRIVLSRTYQLEARGSDATWLAHHARRPLDAEQLRDSMLQVSGDLDLCWPQGSLIAQRDVLINELPSLHQPSAQRSVYLLMLRQSMPQSLSVFGLPDAAAVAGPREESVQAAQALYLFNHEFVLEQSRKLARLMQQRPEDPAGRVRWLFAEVLGRQPAADEQDQCLNFLTEAQAGLSSAQGSQGADAWAALCQVLLISSPWRYLD